MPFRDILKKKEKGKEELKEAPAEADDVPVFTFMRSDTHTQEIISPPTFSSIESESSNPSFLTDGNSESKTGRLFKGRSRSNSNASTTSAASRVSDSRKTRPTTSKRLSERLHLRKSDQTSESVPEDLPEIRIQDGEEEIGTGIESQWEKRATMLARKNEQSRSRPGTPSGSTADLATFNSMSISGSPRGKDTGIVLTKATDDNIQEAIRLHEAGDLEKSTKMFGRLADPNGQNNALSQVLYGLALRHGWGCTPNPEEAVKFLSAAASNAASIEDLALQAGMKKGGDAKGELVLAIFELANCFRHGWGVQVDKFAAKQYYETAANLGDTDAMNEVGWCYLEGFGCKKDKFASARYYRLAESCGVKTLGNSWIWKEKYNPDYDPKSPKKKK